MLIDQTLLSYMLVAIGLVAAGLLVHQLWLGHRMEAHNNEWLDAIKGKLNLQKKRCLI